MYIIYLIYIFRLNIFLFSFWQTRHCPLNSTDMIKIELFYSSLTLYLTILLVKISFKLFNDFF